MNKGFSQILTAVRTSIRGVDTTHQLALGAALGMLLGIMPKDTAFVIVFSLILLLSNGNLVTGAISAIAFSWIGWFIEPVTHMVGLSILSTTGLQPFLANFQSMPLGAWFRAENTVVMGSLTIGLIAALPIYKISYLFLDKYRETLVHFLTRNPLARWILDQSDPDLQEAN